MGAVLNRTQRKRKFCIFFFFLFFLFILLLYTRENLAPDVWSALQPPFILWHLDSWIHDHRVDTHFKTRNLLSYVLPSEVNCEVRLAAS